MLSRLCRVRALEEKRQQARPHKGVWSYPTSCWWAWPYWTNISHKVNVSMKTIWIIVDLFFYGYSVDTYPTRIQAVSDTDTYRIRDTSLYWSIGVTTTIATSFEIVNWNIPLTYIGKDCYLNVSKIFWQLFYRLSISHQKQTINFKQKSGKKKGNSVFFKMHFQINQHISVCI